MLKIGDWINRKRHNRGFGIQSPSAFFFITQVLKERLPYYAYEKLDSIARNCREMNEERCRSLFRIANELAPSSAIVIGSTTAACAISSARCSIPKRFITTGTAIHDEAAAHLAACGCTCLNGDALQLFKEQMKADGTIGMFYIGKCSNLKELLEIALQHTNKESVIIVEGIHRNREQEKLWNRVTSDSRTIITFDMYSIGMLFFNDERYKQHYTLKI